MKQTLDRTLAEHCGPLFYRKKPAALFPLAHDLLASEAFARALSHYGLVHAVLCDRADHALLLVYHTDILQAALSEPLAKRMLRKDGYPRRGSTQAMLAHLRRRLCAERDFPHEIGLFLGYPAEDVLGFIEHKGKHCKHCGLWKVYGDVAQAKALFEEYRQCKQRALYHLESGGSLFTLAQALGTAG